jgi:hypothetical protein
MPTTKERKNISSDVNYSTQKAYRLFQKETGRKDITYEMFVGIPPKVHSKMIKKIFSQSYYIRIPKLGVLKLLKIKPVTTSNGRVDWNLFKKTGTVAYHRNTHSQGFMYKVHLYTYGKKYPMLTCFHFKLAREHSKQLAQLIFKNKIK